MLLVGLTGYLYVIIPKGFFPSRTPASSSAKPRRGRTSPSQRWPIFPIQLAASRPAGPGGRRRGSFVGATGGNSSREQRAHVHPVEAVRATATLRPRRSSSACGREWRRSSRRVRSSCRPAQDISVGGKLSKTRVPVHAHLDRLHGAELLGADHRGADGKAPGPAGRRRRTSRSPRRTSPSTIDRDAASRLGLSLSQIDQTLYDAFGQRQVATIYAVEHASTRSCSRCCRIPDGPVGAVAHLHQRRRTTPRCRSAPSPSSTIKIAPLTINHQGQFPAVTLSFNLAPGAARSARRRAHPEDAGATSRRQSTLRRYLSRALRRSSSPRCPRRRCWSRRRSSRSTSFSACSYESYVHPITILSALPSAGVGALLALMVFGYDLSVIALIGIILLIGIVEEERHHDDRLRARGGTRTMARARLEAIHESLPVALPADHDDDLRRDRRRPAAGHRSGAPAPSFAVPSASPSSGACWCRSGSRSTPRRIRSTSILTGCAHWLAASSGADRRARDPRKGGLRRHA